MTEPQAENKSAADQPQTPADGNWTRRAVIGTLGFIGIGAAFKYFYEGKIEDLMRENAQLRTAMEQHKECQISSEYSGQPDVVRHDVFMMPSLPNRQITECVVSPQFVRLLLKDGTNDSFQHEKDCAKHFLYLQNLDVKNREFSIQIENPAESVCSEMYVYLGMRNAQQHRIHCKLKNDKKTLYVSVPKNAQLLLDHLTPAEQEEALAEKSNTVYVGKNHRGEAQIQATRIGNTVFLSANGPQCIKVKREDGKYHAVPKAVKKEFFGANTTLEDFLNRPEEAKARTL